eukprot:6468420-Amphidinium_carterae.1
MRKRLQQELAKRKRCRRCLAVTCAKKQRGMSVGRDKHMSVGLCESYRQPCLKTQAIICNRSITRFEEEHLHIQAGLPPRVSSSAVTIAMALISRVLGGRGALLG